ncbi:MAG: hypothetical protein WAK20_21360 [Candidatus Acidiferrum sp.]
MKRAILALSCAICLSFGALSASAQDPKGAGVEGKKVQSHWHWWHHEHHKKVKTAPLYTIPRSAGGWFHRHDPGPAGAGVK